MSAEMANQQSFQFHKGAIRTCCCCCLADTTFNFNSIKVRLEHTAQAVADKLFYDFNSIKVRLEQHEIYG